MSEKLFTLDDIKEEYIGTDHSPFENPDISISSLIIPDIRHKLGVERIKKIEDRLKHTFDYEKITKRKAQIEILKEVFNLKNLKEKD